MLTDREKGYLEGIIDGEGCITLGKSRNKNYKRGFTWRIRVRINMTHKTTVLKCAEIIREITAIRDGSIGSVNPQEGKENRKVCHAFTIRAKASRLLLPDLKLVTKEEQRILAIEALELIQENRHGNTQADARLEEIYQRMKHLNRKEI